MKNIFFWFCWRIRQEMQSFPWSPEYFLSISHKIFSKSGLRQLSERESMIGSRSFWKDGLVRNQEKKKQETTFRAMVVKAGNRISENLLEIKMTRPRPSPAESENWMGPSNLILNCLWDSDAHFSLGNPYFTRTVFHQDYFTGLMYRKTFKF